MDHTSDPFFLAGFAALLFVLMTCVFVGLSLFREGQSRIKIMRYQSLVLALQVLFLGWLAATLWQQLDALRHLPEPMGEDLEQWTRRTFSVLLMGITTVFASLLTTFGWVRAGLVGNAMRSVLWAIPSVKLVISAVVVSGLLFRASQPQGHEEAIEGGKLADVASGILAPLESVGTVWVPVCLAMVVISVVISIGKGRNPAAA
jgi:hypothetical protein